MGSKIKRSEATGSMPRLSSLEIHNPRCRCCWTPNPEPRHMSARRHCKVQKSWGLAGHLARARQHAEPLTADGLNATLLTDTVQGGFQLAGSGIVVGHVVDKVASQSHMRNQGRLGSTYGSGRSFQSSRPCGEYMNSTRYNQKILRKFSQCERMDLNPLNKRCGTNRLGPAHSSVFSFIRESAGFSLCLHFHSIPFHYSLFRDEISIIHRKAIPYLENVTTVLHQSLSHTIQEKSLIFI